MLFIDTIYKKNTSLVPYWFMRQAGRYLPEYKSIRANFPNFLEFCYTAEAACEVTLQPITRFDMSAAIIFSDILVIPHGLGMDVQFHEQKGPVLIPLIDREEVDQLSLVRMQEKMQPVYQAIIMTRKKLSKEKSLIGFCGSPWTLACYMLHGSGSRDFSSVRQQVLRDPLMMSVLLKKLCDAIIQHAKEQIKSGADAIQLFDSWSGVLSEYEFEAYVIAPTTFIVQEIKKEYPNIPVIGFPRLCGAKLENYAKRTGVNVVGFDGSVTLDYISEKIQSITIPQGNLDSILLADDLEAALEQTKKILHQFSGTSFIFNLAHGVLPHTPVDHVHRICDVIRNDS